MLAALTISDVVLIDRLHIDFSSGLTVLTGETGAGKSILLDSLSLALGARGDAGLVRAGCDRGQVTAVFDVPKGHPVYELLRENHLGEDGEIILRRVQNADGRTRAFLNDQPIGATLMKQIGAALVEIHGQHDDRALVDTASHRMLLDAFGGHTGEVAEIGHKWQAWQASRRELKTLQAKIEETAREAAYLKSSVEELSVLDPQPDEEEALAARRQAMMAAEKIAGDLNDAFETLNGGGSPIPVLSGLLRGLERKKGQLPELLDPPVAALAESLDRLEEARHGLELALRAADFDAGELERTEERLFALRAASRKFKVPVDRLAELRDTMAADIVDIETGEQRLEALEKQVGIDRERYLTAARLLSDRRQGAAKALTGAVEAELADLKLERARFIVEISSDEARAGAHGIDEVEFCVQTNPGTRPGPMLKVASGGELSRFLLALKVALADRGSAPTLVFDEIDTGVGGAVAEAIGVRLARLARKVQVLSVTHAPQVAARADGHLLISKTDGKDGEGGDVRTGVEEIAERRRTEEIARMLAGATITDEARAAADKLLASAES